MVTGLFSTNKRREYFGRATIPIRGQNHYARIRPLIGMLSGYPRYKVASFYPSRERTGVVSSLSFQFSVFVFVFSQSCHPDEERIILGNSVIKIVFFYRIMFVSQLLDKTMAIFFTDCFVRLSEVEAHFNWSALRLRSG